MQDQPGADALANSPEPATRGWVLGALMCTMMLAAMDTTSVSTAIPQIVGDLGGLRLFTWVFSIYLLTQTVTIPIYGKLSDLFGRKPVLIGGTLLFLVGSAASSASCSWRRSCPTWSGGSAASGTGRSHRPPCSWAR